MPTVVAAGKHRRRVRFPSSNRFVSQTSSRDSQSGQARSTTNKNSPQPRSRSKLVELPSEYQESALPNNRVMAAAGLDQTTSSAPSAATAATPNPTPSLFTSLPPIRDPLITDTSELQDSTVDKCLPFLRGVASSQEGPLNRFGVPRLTREDHVEYLYESLEDFPERFVGLDSSRPWMVYWALTGLGLLGEDVGQFRERVVATFAPMQNATGGYGGGHGQMSHCAPSYAAVLSLATVGGEDAFRLTNRTMMYKWIASLKQSDGGFQVCSGGEEDVRGAYCAMVIIALLDLPLELPQDAEARNYGFNTFLDGLPEYLSRCQTFEGGISGSPGTEAHGAYAFCALACLCIIGEPREMFSKYMDLPLLISWLSARQYAPEGGFAGRTNKLVDGCYSHWVGGCWPLIQAALDGAYSESGSSSPPVNTLYHREGLTRYILGCCQVKFGGLRDKPGKPADSYHTCYILAGLSNTQTYHFSTHNNALSITRSLSAPFSWKNVPIPSAPEHEQQPEIVESVFDEADRLNVIHPVFSIPHAAAENMKAWCEANPERS